MEGRRRKHERRVFHSLTLFFVKCFPGTVVSNPDGASESSGDVTNRATKPRPCPRPTESKPQAVVPSDPGICVFQRLLQMIP